MSLMKATDNFLVDIQIKNIKKDMLKMIDAIEKNEMYIKQLNWKFNNHIRPSHESKSANKKGDTK